MVRSRRVGIGIVVAAMAVTAGMSFGGPVIALPSVAAGMAAHGACSAVFVAGRAAADAIAQDVRPANPLLRVVDVQVDAARRTVVARFPLVATRRATFSPERGCVLDAPAANVAERGADAGLIAPGVAASSSGAPSATSSTEPWPRGDAPLAPADWGDTVDAAALARVLDTAFDGAGDPAAANARGVVVVHRGRLLANRGAPGFEPGTPLHGWSMTKTVIAMLVHQMAAEGRLSLDARVVDAFPRERAPEWVGRWRADARASIAVADLLHMRDGLASSEEYGALGSVPRMLWGEPDVAAFAARSVPERPPGARWRYLSASTNLLSRVARARFDADADYLAYPRRTLFDPIGARTATLETDASGTWIGSSYLWASAADWARLGVLLLNDGRWESREVLAPGFLARAAKRATDDGEGRGYGAQTWRIGDADAGRCRARGLPEDTLAMSGHWGQIVAVVPSRDAVVVRLGWTFDRSKFDACEFVAQVLAALR